MVPAMSRQRCVAKRRCRSLVSAVGGGALLYLVLSAGCSRETGGGPTAPSPTPASLEQQTYARINDYRASKGLGPLSWNEAIAGQARRHSEAMAEGSTPFGHSGFDDRLAIIRELIPWKSAAENVAVDRSAGGAVEGWLSSPGHRANIEGNYQLTGVGAAAARNGSIYFTQVFIEPR